MTDVARESLHAALADRYRIESTLGAGGMATVYRAHDLKHDRDVAIKVLHPDLGAALGGERFLSEIRTTAKLQHPHILPLLDSGAADALLYYVMPLVTGETLRDRLSREKLLPVDDALHITREVADALQYAHAAGIVHRDIKPENILLQGGHALVADFGIALAVQTAGGARMTQTGLSLGTPQYMSPEQATGERVIDGRSDVYALGAVLYEMLTGEPPFTGATVQAIVARLLSEDPRPLLPQRRSIPEHVEAAVLRALEKLPADRFATAAEFANAISGSSPATASSRLAAARRGTYAAHATSVALGAVALVATAAAVWGWTRSAAAPEVVRYQIEIDSVPATGDWFGELAISPDGSTIVRPGGPRGTLLVRHRDQLGFMPIPGTEEAAGPFFSPDGTRIAYYLRGSLVASPIGGGPPQVIADSLPTPQTADWAADGYIYTNLLAHGIEGIARARPASGAKLELVTFPDTIAGELAHFNPHVLPGGKSVLFAISFRNGRRAIGIGDIGARRHTVLFDGARAWFVPTGHLLYSTNDGKLWAVAFDATRKTTSGTPVQVGDHVPSTMVGPVDFAVSASGTLVYSSVDAGSRRELVWVSRAGARQPFDSAWKGEFTNPVFSPDGSRLAVAVREGDAGDIWIKSLSGGAPTRLTNEQHKSALEPAWTPDGHWVSYLVAGGPASTGDVWRQRVDGSGAAQRVLQSRRPLSEQVWTPGGGALIVRTTTPTEGAGDILLMRAGDTITTPLVATPRSEYSPMPSPDGKWLAFVSSETGRLEVYVVPFDHPTAGKWAVSTTGGTSPRWSHKGDELFYLDTRSNLVAVRVATTPSFAVQSSRVLFNASDFIQISASRRNYDVSPDDQRFLMVQRADGGNRGRVVVVEHWADEIRHRTAAR